MRRGESWTCVEGARRPRRVRPDRHVVAARGQRVREVVDQHVDTARFRPGCASEDVYIAIRSGSGVMDGPAAMAAGCTRRSVPGIP